MNTLKTEVAQVASTQNVTITEDTLTVELSDGRTISIPLAWYPRLLHGTPVERNTWRLIGDGEGIHKEPPLDTPQLAGGRKAEIRRRRISLLFVPAA